MKSVFDSVIFQEICKHLSIIDVLSLTFVCKKHFRIIFGDLAESVFNYDHIMSIECPTHFGHSEYVKGLIKPFICHSQILRYLFVKKCDFGFSSLCKKHKTPQISLIAAAYSPKKH